MDEHILNNNLSQNLSIKIFQQDSSQEFIEKRRKLSVLSHSSDSIKNDLNEQFIKLKLNIHSNNLIINQDKITQSSVSHVCSQDSCSPPHLIYIPIPIKQMPKNTNRQSSTFMSNEFNLKQQQNFNPLKTLMSEQIGIQKYLNLDRNESIEDLLQQPIQILENIKKTLIQDKKPNQNPLYYVYGVPANFDFLLRSSTALLKSQISDQDKNFRQQPSARIGKLTRDQRAEKVRIYLQKKHHRQWDTIKYTARQKLADTRQRVNGKFIKEPKYYSNIIRNESQPDSSISELDARLTQSWQGHQDSKGLKDQKKLQNKFLKTRNKLLPENINN